MIGGFNPEPPLEERVGSKEAANLKAFRAQRGETPEGWVPVPSGGKTPAELREEQLKQRQEATPGFSQELPPDESA